MKKYLIGISALIMMASCQNKTTNIVTQNETEVLSISPYEEFKQIDNMLKNISEKPEFFIVAANKLTQIIGKKGTIISVNPENLETKDSTLIGDSIRVELLEMTDKLSLVYNNAQTTSDGELLITGGAYYINMTSNGKQLGITNKGLEVEFPKLSESEMELFLGERDSANQMNWSSVNKGFKSKRRYYPVMTEKRDSVLLTEEEIKEAEFKSKTYEAIKILNLGWINCDRFYLVDKPKTNIQLNVIDTTFSSVRFYAIFENINSVMSANYILKTKFNNSINNIPLNTKLTIIGLSIKDTIPYWFQKTIIVKDNEEINASFIASNNEGISIKLEKMR